MRPGSCRLQKARLERRGDPPLLVPKTGMRAVIGKTVTVKDELAMKVVKAFCVLALEKIVVRRSSGTAISASEPSAGPTLLGRNGIAPHRAALPGADSGIVRVPAGGVRDIGTVLTMKLLKPNE